MVDGSTAVPPACGYRLVMRRWGAQEWLLGQASWDGLLARSDADPLFLSWGWLTQWWQCYGQVLGHPPMIMAFYRGNDLVGLAPLYRRSVRRGAMVRTSSVQMIGLSWRDPEPLTSAYLDVIAAPSETSAVRDACLTALLEDSGWQELVIGQTAAGREWSEAIRTRTSLGTRYVRDLDRSTSYQANLAGGFGPYLKELGQSTRRSVWNLRRRLAERGAIALEQVAPEEIGRAFADLNRLHQLRWNRPAFSGRRLAFHIDLAQGLSAAGELALSRLCVGGNVISVLYDIRKGLRQYNIKMAFNPTFSSRVSLGLIHLGYAMEFAADRGVVVYDFLAGLGQKNDYKRCLGQVRRNLSCVQMLRGRRLSWLYRLYDAAR